MPAPIPELRRLHLRVDGHVQGVGFRLTTCDVAGKFPITGFVANLPDGSVEATAEGSETALLGFLAGLKATHVWRHVTREQISWSDATGEWRGFAISYV